MVTQRKCQQIYTPREYADGSSQSRAHFRPAMRRRQASALFAAGLMRGQGHRLHSVDQRRIGFAVIPLYASRRSVLYRNFSCAPARLSRDMI